MTAITTDDVRAFILEDLTEQLSAVGLHPEQVPDDYDLLAEGVIDSFGIIEMIARIEEHYHLDLDFENLEATQLTVVGAFAAYVAAQVDGAA